MDQQIYCVLIDDMSKFSYQYIPTSHGYIFKGTQEQAIQLLTKLFLEKYNEVYGAHIKTLKEYFIEVGLMDEYFTEVEITNVYNNFYKLENCDEILNGYMLLDKTFDWITEIKCKIININDYL